MIINYKDKINEYERKMAIQIDGLETTKRIDTLLKLYLWEKCEKEKLRELGVIHKIGMLLNKY
ncbi:MAG: hypothetical protein RR942_06630 [Romboutsia sp.]